MTHAMWKAWESTHKPALTANQSSAEAPKLPFWPQTGPSSLPFGGEIWPDATYITFTARVIATCPDGTMAVGCCVVTACSLDYVSDA